MQDEISRIRGPVIHLGDEMLVSNPLVRGPLRLQLSSLVRHAHITGTTGSGKSNTAKVICSGLLDNGIPTVILDRNGEYAEEFGGKEKVAILRPGENLSIALFSLEGEDREAQIADRLSLLNHFYIVCYNQELSPLQGRVVREALSRHYRGSKETLTVSRLIEVLERLMKEAENRGGWPESIEAAISRLWPLTLSRVGATFNRSYSTPHTQEFFQPKLTVVDLSVLPDDNAKNLLSQVILKQVYDEMKRRPRDPDGLISLVFLIDEAHHVCPNKRDYISIPEKCAIELRKYGLSLITCATRPTLVSESIIANSNTLICHMLNNIGDIETAAGFFMRGELVKEPIRKLSVGEAMIQINVPTPLGATKCRVRMRD